MMLLLVGFVALIIAVSLVTPLAQEGNKVTTKTVVTDEAVSATSALIGPQFNVTVNLGPVANVPTSWKIKDCPLTITKVTNVTKTANLAETTDYTLSSTTGVLNMVNSTTNQESFGVGTNNNTYITYSYCPDVYLTADWARTSINTTMGFFALGCFLTSVGMFYAVAKRNGLA